MVGPISEADRQSASRRIKLVFVAIVGVSAGLITLQGDSSLVVFAVATAAGLAFGAVLVWVAFPGSR